MVNILLVSATTFEIEPTLLFLEPFKTNKPSSYALGQLNMDVCITKAGMVNTAFELGKLVGKRYDFTVNAGFAGSFGKYKTGEVVNVTEDCFSELGAEDGELFLSIDALGLGEQVVVINDQVRNIIIDKLPKVKGITVNTVHGYEPSIAKIIEALNPDVETMEGAAFIHAANAFNWKALQLRAISNKVEKRNKNNWQIPLAITNLNAVLIEFIKSLSENPPLKS